MTEKANGKNGKNGKTKAADFEEASQGQPEQPQVDLQAQLNYAQKIITVLQNKVNDLNGKMVQIEAQLLCSNEDRETLIKQRLELEGNTEQQKG